MWTTLHNNNSNNKQTMAVNTSRVWGKQKKKNKKETKRKARKSHQRNNNENENVTKAGRKSKRFLRKHDIR